MSWYFLSFIGKNTYKEELIFSFHHHDNYNLNILQVVNLDDIMVPYYVHNFKYRNSYHFVLGPSHDMLNPQHGGQSAMTQTYHFQHSDDNQCKLYLFYLCKIFFDAAQI
jgi:hypothetical protein